jgi:hypothetical protein
MERYQGGPPERVRLSGANEQRVGPAERAARAEGVRHLRRLTNWTLAAMLVGVGATSAAFAHAIPGLSGGTAAVQTAVVGSTATSGSAVAPAVSGPVATSGGSGVVTAATGSVSGASSGASAVGSGRAVATSEGS